MAPNHRLNGADPALGTQQVLPLCSLRAEGKGESMLDDFSEGATLSRNWEAAVSSVSARRAEAGPLT